MNHTAKNDGNFLNLTGIGSLEKAMNKNVRAFFLFVLERRFLMAEAKKKEM